MNALTFESINFPPRRAAARRSYRPNLRIIETKAKEVPVVNLRSASTPTDTRHRTELIIAIVAAVAFHSVVLYNIRHASSGAPIANIKKPLVIEIAPPPKKELPPPPIVQPKPLSKTPTPITPDQKVTPQPLPVVPDDTPMETTPSEKTVQATTAPVTEPVPVPVAPPPAPVETVTEPRGYAGYLNNPAPEYPAAAQRRGLQGKVLLKVHVLANGKASEVKVANSSGHSILDEAAVKAVTSWMFEPAKRGATPIDGWVQIPLTFKL